MAQQRFYNATEKLMNAFLMGTIHHGDACSCAVGNLCGNGKWGYAQIKNRDSLCEPERHKWDKANYILMKTDYSIFEIFEIEKEFEGRAESLLIPIGMSFRSLEEYNDPDGFIGLCRVFDYLVSIEDWKEEEEGMNIFELLETAN